MEEQQKRLLDVILETCDYLSSITGIDKLSASFVNSLAEVFNVNKVSFMLLDEIKGELSIKAFRGLDPAVTQSRVKLGELFSGWVAKEGKPLLVKNIETEFPDLPKSRLTHYSTKSFVIVPIKNEQRIIGVVSLTDRKGRESFTDEDLKALNLISSYFALHIENSKLLERNKQLSILDPLTDLFNHSYFHAQLLEEIYRAERYRRALSITILDIDKFSDYNMVHSYTAGDNVLKQTGRLIKENIRQIDVLSRYGPDEFSIILPETRLKEALFVGEKIREKIESAIFTETEDRKSSLGMVRLTVSVGIAEHSIGLTEEELNRHAASALSEAQQEGGNCVCVFR
jgi:diguanylate cyclase (GGDEF)-like protein